MCSFVIIVLTMFPHLYVSWLWLCNSYFHLLTGFGTWKLDQLRVLVIGPYGILLEVHLRHLSPFRFDSSYFLGEVLTWHPVKHILPKLTRLKTDMLFMTMLNGLSLPLFPPSSGQYFCIIRTPEFVRKNSRKKNSCVNTNWLLRMCSRKI